MVFFYTKVATLHNFVYLQSGWSLDAVRSFAKMVENKPMLLTVSHCLEVRFSFSYS